MTERIVAPQLLRLYASSVDWQTQAREWYGLARDDASRKHFGEIMQAQPNTTLQLRWMLNSLIGLTRAPFRVYVRHGGAPLSPIPFTTTTITSVFPRRFDLPQPMAIVQLTVTVNAGAALYLTAYSTQGKPVATGSATIPGTQSVFLVASNAAYLIARGDGTISAISAVSAASFASLPDWQLIEKVGFPLAPAEYAGTNYNPEPQGLVASPVPALDAALRRLKVGQPLLGWAPTTSGGVPVPPWSGPDLTAFLKEVRDTVVRRVLDLFHHGTDTLADAAYVTSEPLEPPAQQGGSAMDPTVSTADVPPIALCLLAAAGDPFNSLSLGFGTAFEAKDLQGTARVGNTGIAPAASTGPVLDAMVVAEYTIAGTAIEIADFAIAIGRGTPPGDPVNVASALRAQNRPHVLDGPFTAAFDTSWTRPQPVLDTTPRIASYGLLRAAAPTAPGILLRERSSGGWAPFVPARAPNSDETVPIVFNDGDVGPPGNPANAYSYSVAGQDLFGRWTHWVSADVAFPAEPHVAPALAEATFAVQGNGPNPCPATLTLDFSWDWTDRRPLKITIAGTLFRPPDATTPLPAFAPSTGMQYALGAVVGPPVEIDFDVAGTPTVAVPGATVSALPPAAFTSPQHDIRAYRLTLPGFSLDFADKKEVVLYLWATGYERIAPADAVLSATTRIAHAISPIPPVVPFTPDHVVWAGLPDHAGVSRAHLSWTGSGPHYVVYEATETALRASAGLESADLTQPIPLRLAVLRGLDLGVHRQAFRRLTTKPIDAAEYEAELPRGSRMIHAFALTAIDDNNVESDWPTAGTSFIASATPSVQVPKPPRLRVDVVPSGTGKAAKITIETRPGAPVAFVELYRTSTEACARNVNLMGPPIARSDSAGWTVQTNAPGAVVTASYTDVSLTPSWSRVWYRAIAWTADDLVNGFYAARSDPSSSFAVIVPPATPPSLSSLSVRVPGSTADRVLVTFESDAPIGPTALGSHVLTITVRDPDKPPSEARTFRRDVRLEVLRGFPTLTSAPDATSPPGTTFRLSAAAPPIVYGTWIPRPSRTPVTPDDFNVAVALRDPLGRVAQVSETVSWT